VEEIRNTGAEAEFIRADVRHEDDIGALVDQTIGRGSNGAAKTSTKRCSSGCREWRKEPLGAG
jgi:hypothetical protein